MINRFWTPVKFVGSPKRSKNPSSSANSDSLPVKMLLTVCGILKCLLMDSDEARVVTELMVFKNYIT